MKKLNQKTKNMHLRFLKICIMLFAVGIMFGCNSESKKDEKLLLAEQYLAEQNFEQAQSAYNELIEMDVQCTEAYIGLAKIHILNGSYDLAKGILEQGLAAGMSLESLELPEAGDTELDKVYIAVLAMTAGEMSDAQQAIACYRQIDTVATDYVYSADQLNALAKSVLEQEDGLLDVLGFCNEKMLANPELEMDAEIAAGMIYNAVSGKITYTKENYFLIDDWFIANIKHPEAIEKFLEKNMNFKYPTPGNTDFSEQADEFIAQYQGDYLIRHFFLSDAGELIAINYEDGDYGVYNDRGMILFDSATDIQDNSQDGLLDVKFFYDEQNRLIRFESSYEDFLDGTIPVCMEYVYNEAGQLTTVLENGRVDTSIKFDGQGRVTEIRCDEDYYCTYKYDDANGMIYGREVDLWEETSYDFEDDLSVYDAPIKYRTFTYLSQDSYANCCPFNEFILSDGTKMLCTDGWSTEFYLPDEANCYNYNEQCFDLNETFYCSQAKMNYEIHVEQVVTPAEDCINSHLAGKKYWAENEYGKLEVVYDEYGLCDYTYFLNMEGDNAISCFNIYLKKYNEDGSIYSCPVQIIPGVEYDYLDSQYTNAFSGYCYQEYYR